MTNNCQRETIPLMSVGDERRGNDESRCVPESQEAEISRFSLVWKRCQRRTVMASCLPVTRGERGS